MNKKGFTLIELLAVIVIMGIILAIAIPAVGNIIRNSTVNSFKNDTENLIRALEYKKASDDNFNPKEVNENNVKSILDIDSNNYESISVDLEGNKIFVLVVGKNKWAGLVACGIRGEIVVGDGSQCDLLPTGPLYTDAEIDNMIANGYIPIASATELNNLRNEATNTFGAGTKWQNSYLGGLDKKYVQVANIDLSDFSSGSGWNPIGNHSDGHFAGIYDGNNYTISNLFINSSASFNGLFGVVNGDETELKNIVFKNVNITTTSDSVGTLAGFVISAKTIENIQATGKISSTGRENVGGLIGLLVAYEVVIDNVTTTIDVTGDYYVGGLIGSLSVNSTITNSSAKGNVTGTSSVGGLLGFTVGGSLKNSYATGDIKGNENVGGLIGTNQGMTIDTTYATGNVTGGTGTSTGGLIGFTASGNVTKSYATGNVTGSGDVGGLIGFSGGGTFHNTYATGDVEGDSYVGGLVGDGQAIEIKDSYAEGSVSGNEYIGGFIGYAAGGKITNSYAKGTVNGTNYIGGFVGQSDSFIYEKNYALGSVTGTSSVGGFIGRGGGTTLKNNYTRSSVSGTGNFIGGFLGELQGDTIENVYAAGSLSGGSNVGGVVGGPLGAGPPTFGSYWDITISGVSTSAAGGSGSGVFGKTTAEMKTQATYLGWDFTNIWAISASVNDGYPHFK